MNSDRIEQTGLCPGHRRIKLPEDCFCCVTNNIIADLLAYNQNTQDKSPSEIFIWLNS